mgnify:CR=1 FL=1
MARTAAQYDSPTLRDRVARVIELMRPAVQADGGDLELVGITQSGIVRVRFHGACVGCPSATMTLQMGIERNLKAHVPEVSGVESVD